MVLDEATLVKTGRGALRGTRLAGRYIVTGALRDDGGSVLYAGRIASVGGEPIMIKEVMSDDFVSAENRTNSQARFLREVQILQELRHPSLPIVLDAFVENARHYLVMSYSSGETLDAMLARRGVPFAETDVVGWALEVLSALGVMHRHNPPVIYRNLKPGNVVIDPTGTVRLLDFGLARFFTQGKRRDTAPLGSVGYAPPEQTTGATDARSDLYALGVTMHQLLTNQHPTQHPPGGIPPATTNPAGSTEVSNIIARAIERDPGRRWSSAAEMELALRRHVMSGGPSPRPRQSESAAEAAGTRTTTCARLVVTSIRPLTGRDEIVQHLMRLTWMTRDSLDAALSALPAVLPLVEPYKSSLLVLKGLGLEAAPVWPLRGMHTLDSEAEAWLQLHGHVEVGDPTAGDEGICLCRHCHFGWMLEDATDAPPGECPSCGRAGWDTMIIRRCQWCSHEYQERGPDDPCPCCGLSAVDKALDPA